MDAGNADRARHGEADTMTVREVHAGALVATGAVEGAAELY